MADSLYQIKVNPEEEIACNFPVYLFNEDFYISRQPCEGVFTFYLIHTKKDQVYARFSLFRQKEKGISPCRGTFGSIEMNPALPVQYLDYFIQQIDSFASQQGIKQIEIKSYPFCYNLDVASLITSALLRQQYQILHTELNYHIPITNKAFTDGLHVSARRRLQKCISMGFTSGQDKNPDLAFIYQMIVQSRERKGYPVSMSFDVFRQMFTDFPGIYKIFTVKDNSKTVAVTVAVEINKQILYYFLPAHAPSYNTYSPMILLIQSLYDYCRQAGFALLDLGISTDKGVPNYGLMRFKQNMGALSSLKLSFVKNLTSEPY